MSNSITASVYVFYSHDPSPDDLPVAEAAAKIIEASLGLETFLSEYNFTPFTPQELERWRDVCGCASVVTAHTSLSAWDHDALLQEISLVKSIGGSILVVHPGTFGLEKCDNPPSTATLKDICRYALDNGIYLAFENSGRTGMAMMERALDIIGSDPDDTGLGICIDTGHANRSIPLDGIPAETYIKRFNDVIIELHLNDNLGAEDLHLPPGQGTINWPAVFDAIRHLTRDTVLCLELAGGANINPLDMLAQAKEYVTGGLRMV